VTKGSFIFLEEVDHLPSFSRGQKMNDPFIH
jgi:hypothetical protein